MKDKFLKALEELRKAEKEKHRNFNQSVDFIVNLRDFDVKKQSVNIFVELPLKVRDAKICAFLDKPSKVFDFCITKHEIARWQDKKEIKKLVKRYDFFVSLAALMPQIATKFGKFLGPAGKMPSPQLGILTSQDEKREAELAGKINKTIRIKTKESSIKVVIGKQDMKDEVLVENAAMVYNAIIAALQKGKENVKSVMLKFTMSKPVKVDLK